MIIHCKLCTISLYETTTVQSYLPSLCNIANWSKLETTERWLNVYFHKVNNHSRDQTKEIMTENVSCIFNVYCIFSLAHVQLYLQIESGWDLWSIMQLTTRAIWDVVASTSTVLCYTVANNHVMLILFF